MDAAAFGRQISKMGVYDMTSFESRKTGQKQSRKWLHPSTKGWRYATHDVIQHFKLE